jgi:probable HAF family extracellular repeat protein
MAINRHGEIVGSYGDEKTRLPRACLWKQDKFHDIHGQGVSSTATSINALGHAVGTYTTDKGQTRAFLWDGKKMRDLTTMITDRRVFVISSAAMIDDRGWIVGTITWGKEHAYEACVLRPA